MGKYPVKKNGGITFLKFFARHQPYDALMHNHAPCDIHNTFVNGRVCSPYKLPFHAKVTNMPFVRCKQYSEKSGKKLIIQECVLLGEPNKIGYTNVL